MDSPIIEVAIGIIFIYVVFSILITQMNTIITNLFRLRARHLHHGIQQLVEDPEVVAKIFAHPLVRLSDTQTILPNVKLTDEQAEAIIKSGVNNVTWIDPEIFVEVITHILNVTDDTDLYQNFYTIIDLMPSSAEKSILKKLVDHIIETGEGIEQLQQYIQSLEPDNRRAFEEVLKSIALNNMQEGGGVGPLKAGLSRITGHFLRNSLEAILMTTKNIEEARKKIETWFNEGMDRTSKAFAQQMQLYSLAIAVIITVIINVDSLQIARVIWEDPELRAQLVTATDQASLNQLQATFEQALERQDIDDTASLEEIANNISQTASEAQVTLNTLTSLRLPLGWYYEDLSGLDRNDEANAQLFNNTRNLWLLWPGSHDGLQGWFGFMLTKLIGLGATAIAAAQGAPFWFDILNRIRSGGK